MEQREGTYSACIIRPVMFLPKNKVVAFPKIEIKWDWVSDVQVYIKYDAVIWFWRYCHVKTRHTSENSIMDRKCVVRANHG